MTGVQLIAGLLFEVRKQVAEEIGGDFHLCAAATADQVMMVAAGQVVGQMPVAAMGGEDDAVGTQKFQRAIDSRFGHASVTDTGVNLGRGEVAIGVQGIQDGQPLRGHAVAACAQGLGMVSNAGHRRNFLIAKNINSNYIPQ
jgi:hypothetical protein